MIKTQPNHLNAARHEKTGRMERAAIEENPGEWQPDNIRRRGVGWWFGTEESRRFGNEDDRRKQTARKCGEHRLSDPPGGRRPERLAILQSLPAHQQKGPTAATTATLIQKPTKANGLNPI